jgi:hypothetical protein
VEEPPPVAEPTQEEPAPFENAVIRHTRFGEHDIYMDVSEIKVPSPDVNYNINLNMFRPVISKDSNGSYTVKLFDDFNWFDSNAPTYNIESVFEQCYWFDKDAAVLFDMQSLSLAPIAYEMPEEYQILAMDDGFFEKLYGVTYAVEDEGETVHWFQAQTWDGELVCKLRFRDDFLPPNGEDDTGIKLFDSERVVYHTSGGPYQVSSQTGEISRYKGENTAELPGGWILGATQEDSSSPWVYTLYDENDEAYGKPVTPEFTSTSFSARGVIAQTPENVYWAEEEPERILIVTNGTVYCHMNFDTGTHTYERQYSLDTAVHDHVTTSEDGRFEVHKTAYGGAGDGNWHDTVLLDTLDESVTFLYEGYGYDRSLFGKGYTLFIEDQRRIINAETNETIAYLSLPENTISNASCYDSDEDCFVVATTIDYNPGSMDQVISPITLYVISGSGEILRTVETGLETFPFHMYSVQPISMELDGNGYAVLFGEDKVYYRE